MNSLNSLAHWCSDFSPCCRLVPLLMAPFACAVPETDETIAEEEKWCLESDRLPWKAVRWWLGGFWRPWLPARLSGDTADNLLLSLSYQTPLALSARSRRDKNVSSRVLISEEIFNSQGALSRLGLGQLVLLTGFKFLFIDSKPQQLNASELPCCFNKRTPNKPNKQTVQAQMDPQTKETQPLTRHLNDGCDAFEFIRNIGRGFIYWFGLHVFPCVFGAFPHLVA